jgi:ankyrin repeat protein
VAATGFRKDAIRQTAAEQIATFRYLLDVGADVNAKDKGGITPLIWVVYNETLQFASFLLENDADSDDQCECKTLSGGGWTALTGIMPSRKICRVKSSAP